ncbi:radical SAM protein [Leptospira sp. 2 VSF19]|uniref:Radical SAM protein n=1 Tax=Leptospira soteropolitanensis TaxID=2950025 RepID=A0AAW5VLV0_9LEPT|nr:B12-binding domain-containing radical SAM protein [Leptospira soteropolitanensis]MCW7492997.1 radical SAM protein [Leptospira soteropolitanensis]MCW7500232.1 radical SAM protein [Leptospira soteropolitanensis]MCW7522483.1 radical SAM protein [Leptospira soteropolitanensis]MCW7526339.1 radical SAM protein [Leptospira soteropolitanensis]MCW7529549.1 radical SAM protein [Leptospira soteropolitanensis]
MAKIQFLQLPVPPPSYYAATGNVPLAAASLASCLASKDDPVKGISPQVVSPEDTDSLGDKALIDRIVKEGPDFLGLSLYLWNTERSLYIAKEVKKRSPETTILIGGPEVNEDNPYVLGEEGYDIAVSGEAEHSFRNLMRTLLSRSSLEGLENVAYRKENGNLTSFGKPVPADFPLTDFPSPYTTGHLKVDPKRSTYLETVRGCKSQCTYCFYPKSSQNLRTLDIPETIRLISHLKEKGARELVFLDPTFNHRPGFENFLDAIAEINADGQMSMFAELRSEGVTPKLATKLRKAGFTRVELGLQSVNEETLKRVKRYGSPHKVAEVAKMLAGEGMELLLDLIIGLPGDKPEDVERGIHFFLEHGLGEWVQAFPLSVLPGTAMRRDAEKEGLSFMPTPPYRIIQTPTFSSRDLTESLYFAEDLLERRLDEFPRPFLCSAAPDKNDRIDLMLGDIENSSVMLGSNPWKSNLSEWSGSRHHSVWFHTKDLSKDLSRIIGFIEERIAAEPFCTIDFVIPLVSVPKSKEIQKLVTLLESKRESYLSRTLAHRGENLQHRLVFVFDGNHLELRNWRNEELDSTTFLVFERVSTSKIQSLDPSEEVFYLLEGEEIDPNDFEFLKQNMDPETITFLSRKLEERWSMDVLGYGEL